MVHLLRSAMKYASYTDRKTMAKDMKPIYTAATVQAAEMAMWPAAVISDSGPS